MFPSERQYPKEVRVRDKTYQIRFVNRIEGDSSVLGICYDSRCLIKIKRQKCRKALYRTFVHELLHAIDAEWHLKLKHKVVYKLDRALTRYLTDNFL